MRITKGHDTRRQHSDALKRALVERSLDPGASVAAIAQKARVNANLLSDWRWLHRQAQAGPLLDEIHAWLSGLVGRVSAKSELARAIGAGRS